MRDADREPLVEQLVRHHVPVGDLARERREAGASPSQSAAIGAQGWDHRRPTVVKLATFASGCACRPVDRRKWSRRAGSRMTSRYFGSRR